MPSGGGRGYREAETQGGGAQEGALDEAKPRRGPADRAGGIQRRLRK